MVETHTTARAQLIGISFVLVSTAAIAIVPTAAKLALEGGSNTLTVVTARGVIAAAVIAVLMLLSKDGFRIRKRALKWSVMSGLCYCLMSYGFIGSVAYIPVSLMVLIYFTHPLLIALVEHWTGNSHLTSRKVVLAIVVFLGLAIVLGSGLTSLNLPGVGLAVLAAVSVCGMILFNAKAQEDASSKQVNLYMTLVTVVVFISVTTLSAAWSMPVNAIGWLGLLGAGIGLAVGLLTFFAAFWYIGPVRATMVSNIEPLLGVLFAVAVLGEDLEFWQWAGVILVVGALVLFEVQQKSRASVPDVR